MEQQVTFQEAILSLRDLIEQFISTQGGISKILHLYFKFLSIP